jgi:hypothetical protein
MIEIKEIKEGFYYSKYEPNLPMPYTSKMKLDQDLITKLRVIMYKLDTEIYSNAYCEQYMGFSECRLCNKPNGSKEYYIIDENKKYIFPEGYLHYIEEHNIIPSDEFINLLQKINKNFFQNRISTSKLDLIIFNSNTDEFIKISPLENLSKMFNGIGGLQYSS